MSNNFSSLLNLMVTLSVLPPTTFGGLIVQNVGFLQIWWKSPAFGNNCMILSGFELIPNPHNEIIFFLYEYCRTQLSLNLYVGFSLTVFFKS
ncbi:MAG: hypothetical protein ACJAWV_001300 [Flammeovirgaceae bacterium]